MIIPAKLWIFLIAASLFRIIVGNLFPLTVDEAYYWLWSKHPDFSYVDHPPMISYINFLMTSGKENLFYLRSGTVIISLAVSISLYYLGKEYFNEKTAFRSAVLFQIIPHFLIVWITMFVELPLAIFWTLSLLVLAKIIKCKKHYYWYILGVITGLGYLSKYTMFLFWPCLLLYLIISSENRYLLKTKELYISFLISLLFFSPVIYWNSNHQWISFSFHGSRITGNSHPNFLEFTSVQLIHFSPFLIFTLYWIYKWGLKKNEYTKSLVCFSMPILLISLLLSFKTTVWPHWPSIGYIGVIPLIIEYFSEKSFKKFILCILSFNILILIVLFWFSPGILNYQKNYALNYELSKNIPSEYKIFSESLGTSSLLEFYTKRTIYMTTGFLKVEGQWGEKQYKIWGTPDLKKGETILYYGEDNREIKDRAFRYFEKITEVPFRLYVIEDYINNYKMLKLEGYKYNSGHP